MYVPNAFTPDNDGVNDAFHPLGAGYEGKFILLQCLQPLGELVFETTDPDVDWYGQDKRGDGTHFVPDGVYGYRVNVKATTNLLPHCCGDRHGRALRKGLLAMLTSVVLYTERQTQVSKSCPIWARFSWSFFDLPCRCCCVWPTCVAWASHFWGTTGWLVLRGIAGMLGLAGFFHTVKHIPLASATVIQYFSPAFTVLLAFLFGNERVHRSQWLFLVLALLGIVMVKGFDPRVPGACGGWADVVGLLCGGGVPGHHEMSRLRPPGGGGGVVSPLGRSPSWARLPQWTPMTTPMWGLALAIGLLSIAAQVLMTVAVAQRRCRNGDAVQVPRRRPRVVAIGWILYGKACRP